METKRIDEVDMVVLRNNRSTGHEKDDRKDLGRARETERMVQQNRNG